jgi:hypothetical protein
MTWLTGWEVGHRKEITLSNSGSILTNYQVSFTVYRSSGSDSGTSVYVGTSGCLSDYDDIRFTSSDGTTLQDYWIESSDSSSAKIWVEFTSIPAGSSTWYIYYGNSSATAVSNGVNTFILFDDFLGGTLDAGKWTPSGTPTVGSSVVTIEHHGGSGETISSLSTYPTNTAWRSRIKTAHFANVSYFESGGYFAAWNNRAVNYFSVNTSPYQFHTNYSGGDDRSAIDGWIATVWGIAEIKRNSTTSIKYTINDSNLDTHTSRIPTGSLNIGYSTAWEASSTGAKVEVDWVLVRKYTEPEPTISAWGEKELGPLSIDIYISDIAISSSGSVVGKLTGSILIEDITTDACGSCVAPRITTTSASHDDLIIEYPTVTTVYVTPPITFTLLNLPSALTLNWNDGYNQVVTPEVDGVYSVTRPFTQNGGPYWFTITATNGYGTCFAPSYDAFDVDLEITLTNTMSSDSPNEQDKYTDIGTHIRGWRYDDIGGNIFKADYTDTGIKILITNFAEYVENPIVDILTIINYIHNRIRRIK